MKGGFSEPVEPIEGTVPIRGRVIGALLDEEPDLAHYKLRIPDNGLWWVEGDWENQNEGRYRDVWIRQDDNCPTRCALKDWVKATPVFRGPSCPYPLLPSDDLKDRLPETTLRAMKERANEEAGPEVVHYGYEIEVVGPIQVDFYLEEALFRAHPLDDGAAWRPTLNLRISSHPDIDGFFSRWWDENLALGWDSFKQNPPLGVNSILYICSCGEWGCASIRAWVEREAGMDRIVWREIERVTGDGFDVFLGPALSFDQSAYCSAQNRHGHAGKDYRAPYWPVEDQPTYKDHGLKRLVDS